MSDTVVNPKTVDEYLNGVSYSDIERYVPSLFALEFVNFIKLVNADIGLENKTPPVHYKIIDSFIQDGDVINMCHRGMAKALDITTRIPTPEGWTSIEDLRVGDYVFGEDGKPTKVLGKSEIFNRPMYQLNLVDGRSLRVCEDHINTIIHRRQKRVEGRRVNYLDRRNVTTKELLDINLTTTRNKTAKNPKGKENRVWIPLPEPVQYPTKELPIDPYTLGLLLGDGSMDRNTGYARLYAHKDDMPYYLNEIPHTLGKLVTEGNKSRVGINGIGSEIKNLRVNCHGNHKFIPEIYRLGSIEQRLALLQGLMDTDGTVYKNGCTSYTSNSFMLITDIQELVFSLGGTATVSPNGDAYRLNISLNLPLFKLPRKLDRQHFNCQDKVALESIEPIGQVPSQCIAIDNESKTFVAGEYVVTHNSTLKEYLMLYIAVYGSLQGLGEVANMIYVSDSVDNGIKKMRKSLEFRYNNSSFLQTYISKIVFTDIRWEFINVNGHSLVVSAYGAKQGIRGARENNSRPVLALMDDLISDDDAKSPTLVENISDTITYAIEFALHPTRRKVIWSGTPFNQKDPLYMAACSGAWIVNAYPVCEEFPCSREDFRGSWEDRFNYDYVLKMYNKLKAQGKVESFYRELMLRIMSEEDRMVLDSDISWFNAKDLMNMRGNYNFYITTDLATSDKKSADFSVISVWAYGNNRDWFLVDGICKKQTLDKTVDDLFRLCSMYKPLEVGIEITGQQKGFIPWITKEMIQRNIFFNLASGNNNGEAGIRPATNKLERFKIAHPIIKLRKLYLPSDRKDLPIVVEMLAELALITFSGIKARHDDCIDTISMLPMLNVFEPSETVSLEYNKRDDIWEAYEDKDDDFTGYTGYTV